MKTIGKTLKILILTILTGGIYGAYWIAVNLFREPDDPDMGDAEKQAGESQNTIALAWLHFINRQ